MYGKGWLWVHAAQQAHDLNVAEAIADSETRGVKLERLRVRFWLRVLKKSHRNCVPVSAFRRSGHFSFPPQFAEADIFRFRLSLLRRFWVIGLVG